MSYYWRKKILLVKKELTYGTDPSPTEELNSMRTFDFNFDPFAADNIAVAEDKPEPGSDAETLVGKHGVLTFSTYAAGAGSAGDIPPLDPLFAACGYVGTPDDDQTPTMITYSQVFPATDSVTFYADIDGILHKFTGARGTFEFVSEKRNFPRFNWTFTGLFQPVAASSLNAGDVDTSAWLKAVPFRAAIVDVELHSTTIACHSLTITAGETVEFYEHSESESIETIDRASRYSLRMEEPAIGDFNVFKAVDDEDLGNLEYVHGTEAGEIIEIIASQVQMTAPGKNEEQGRTALDIEGPLVANSTNSFQALSIVFR